MTILKKLNKTHDICHCATCDTYYVLPPGVGACHVCKAPFIGRASADSAIAESMARDGRFEKFTCGTCQQSYGAYEVTKFHAGCPLCGADKY